MRKEFSLAIKKIAVARPEVLFLTGDLGFMALEDVRKAIGKRFINAGVSEQNMVTMAAGLALQGHTVICYSIAPFAVFRPAEQIRLDVCLHNMDVKIVGNGGGYGYGVMGATHHAIEDIAVLSSYQNMRCYIPFCNEDVEAGVDAAMKRKGPAYLRLGYGVKPASLQMPAYEAAGLIARGNKLTIACMGPVALNAFKALEVSKQKDIADLFVIREVPLPELPREFLDSVKKTKKLLVIEEHVARGGLGEYLSLLLMKKSIGCAIIHRHALGYPGGLYGSQSYHQKLCGLDSEALAITIKELA
ncbi:MAG: transketolase [Elusimicrobiota bacterium]